MKKRHDYSVRDSALQIIPSVALVFFPAILMASTFKVAPSGDADRSRPILKPCQSVTRTSQSRQLSLADRIDYQGAIEEVYWRHRIWPKERTDLKPPFNEVMTPSQIEQKVEDYLRNCHELEDYWQQPIRPEQLQAEMERMARDTRQPEILRELFAALGNDPFVIAECLARPTLSERLVTNVYTHGQRFQREPWQPSETDLRSQHSFSQKDRLKLTAIESQREPFEPWRTRAENETPNVIGVATADYSLPTLSNTVNGFTEDSRIANTITDAPTSMPSCMDDTWTDMTAASAPTGRSDHTAIWTGSEMIVWGGHDWDSYVNTGGRYDPATDSWTPTSTTNAPTPRDSHTAIWTGTEMIVWGGMFFDNSWHSFNTGGRYNPGTNSWTATSTTNASTGRGVHTAVWTGSEMIVWGGQDNGFGDLNTGGKYNPSTDSWTATNIINAPAARIVHTAVWTGSEMIVWGGGSANENFNTGGRYDPGTDTWTATNIINPPSRRGGQTAVWTGSEMIVWGGYDAGFFLNTAGRYNPSTDTWIAVSTIEAPAGRIWHTAIWTGNEMIVWGGYNGPILGTGGRYDPPTDSWRATNVINAPSVRYHHKAVWTGGEMIVSGGHDNSPYSPSIGGRYCSQPPTTPTPSPTPPPTSTPTPTPPPTVTISGTVSYCSNPVPGPVSDVTLTLSGDAGISTLSDGSGNYTLSSLTPGGSYTVTPAKSAVTPGSAGINTVDVVATQRHFLVIGTPLTGCRLTAADVNGDSAVNTVDVVAIQRFFLILSTGTANVGKYQFNPASRSYSGIVSDQTGQNYDTLVFGDVAPPFAE